MLAHYQGQPIEITGSGGALVTGPDEMTMEEYDAEQAAWDAYEAALDAERGQPAAGRWDLEDLTDPAACPFD